MLQILVSNDRCSKMKALWTIFVVCLISGLEASIKSEENSGNNGKSGSSLPRSPVIQTKYGQVQGRILTFKGTRLQPVAAFKGIPYATPPVGSNRWEPTRAPGPWDGVMQAITSGPVCPQSLPSFPFRNHVNYSNGSSISDAQSTASEKLEMPRPRLRFLQWIRTQLLRQSEDCLYLNIFVPNAALQPKKGPSNNQQQPLAVMVYVHGESFKWGSGNLWDAQVLASYGNVIVITFNYRLGILGFLNANGSPLTRGQVSNYGIMDQMAVLQWVQENIVQFGGDPQRVTLIGHGTGAACIEYLTHSPTTVPGLFHRVILMSGSLFAPWSRVRDPLNYALQLGRKFNCSIPTDLTNEHGKVVDCLRNVTAEKLMSAQLNVPSFHLDFGPSFDGVTIKNNFADIKGKRSFGTRTYDALIGIVTHDFFDELSDKQVRHGLSLQQRDKMLQTFVRNHYNAHLQEILLTLQNEYTDWTQQASQHPSNIKEQVLQAFSDGLYASPAIFSAGTFARKSKNTYFYHFTHASKSGPYAQLPHIGSTHGSELPYVFGIPLFNAWKSFYHVPTNRQDETISRGVMTYWTNFAKTGNPNKNEDRQEKFELVHWDSYDNHQKYLELGLRPRVLHHYRGHKMSIWLSLIPQLQKTGQNSIYPSHNSLLLDGGDGPSWGVVRNSSGSMMANIDNKAKNSLNPPSTTCMTLSDSTQVLHQHNDTLLRLEAASKSAYSYALGITVGLGGILCFLNGMLLLCLCQKRRKNGRNANNEPHSNSMASIDYLTSSQPQTPHLQHRSQEFSTLPVRGQRAVIMTSQPPNSQTPHQYRTFQSPPRRTSTSYVQVPRPDIDLTRPSSSLSSTATFRGPGGGGAGGPNGGQHQRASIRSNVQCNEDFALEPIPAPPAQFNTENEDTIAPGENVALIRSPALKGNGHATILR